MEKIGQILKKIENFSLLKAQYFMNEMHEYEIKSFRKNLNSTQIFQNQDFQSICSQSANIKHILH